MVTPRILRPVSWLTQTTSRPRRHGRQNHKFFFPETRTFNFTAILDQHLLKFVAFLATPPPPNQCNVALQFLSQHSRGTPDSIERVMPHAVHYPFAIFCCPKRALSQHIELICYPARNACNAHFLNWRVERWTLEYECTYMVFEHLKHIATQAYIQLFTISLCVMVLGFVFTEMMCCLTLVLSQLERGGGDLILFNLPSRGIQLAIPTDMQVP
jgi:hypothetical protein